MDCTADDYITARIDPEPPHLHRLWRDSNLHLVNGRMASGHLQGRLLKMLVQMIKPRRVLELGTFSGYSAQCIAEGLEEAAVIDTIEIDDELEDFITSHMPDREIRQRINLHFGDALEIAPRLAKKGEPYDLVFIDADKRQYCEYYEMSLGLVKPGGFIIADNTLWDGHVFEPGRHDAQTTAIREFNDRVAADSRVEKVILPLRDGLTLIRVKPNASPRV